MNDRRALNLNSVIVGLSAVLVFASALVYAVATERATRQAAVLNERLAAVEARADALNDALCGIRATGDERLATLANKLQKLHDYMRELAKFGEDDK